MLSRHESSRNCLAATSKWPPRLPPPPPTLLLLLGPGSGPPLCVVEPVGKEEVDKGNLFDVAMDGNLGLTTLPDRVISGLIKGSGSGEGAGRAAVETLGGARGCSETASTMVESASPEWTDEKHSLYLKSMEASFVNQLYSHEFNSIGLWGWTPKIDKDADSPRSKSWKINSGQVLRGGCWGEVKFEMPRTRTDVRNESCVLARNPWMQHFMSGTNNRSLELLSSEHLGNCQADSPEIHVGQRHDVEDFREATSSNLHLDCCPHLSHLDYVGSNAEVSDQNFVDDVVGAKPSRRMRKKKRPRTTFSDTRDQLVPFGKAPAKSNDDVDFASLKEKEAEFSGTEAAKCD